MDAVKFIEERRRMCNMHRRCTGCEAFLDNDSCVFSTTGGVAPIEQVKFLEEWSAAHPRKTRQDVFLKQWPEAYIHENGYLDICPLEVSAAHRDADGCCATLDRLCPDCRREFWMQEVE